MVTFAPVARRDSLSASAKATSTLAVSVMDASTLGFLQIKIAIKIPRIYSKTRLWVIFRLLKS
jgi:hypothetical protein